MLCAQLDAKYAEELATSSGDYGGGGLGSRRRGLQLYGRVSPEAIEEEEQSLLARFATQKRDVCESGQECQRTDAQHFLLKYHPEVACPLCGEMLPVYEVNAHVTICLDRPASARPMKKVMEKDGDAAMDGGASSAAAPAAAAPGFPNSGAFSSAAIAIPSLGGSGSVARSRSRKLPKRSASLGTGSGSQQELDLLGSPGDEEDDDAAADDEAEDDDVAPPLLMRNSSTTAVGNAGLARSNSDLSLSLAQASAVASLLIARKNAAQQTGSSSGGGSSSSGGEKDPSLAELLNKFSSIGFTRQNLEALHAKHTSENAPAAAAAAAPGNVAAAASSPSAQQPAASK